MKNNIRFVLLIIAVFLIISACSLHQELSNDTSGEIQTSDVKAVCDAYPYSSGYVAGVKSAQTGQQYYNNPYNCTQYYNGYWAGFNSITGITPTPYSSPTPTPAPNNCANYTYSNGYIAGVLSAQTGQQYYNNPYNCSAYYTGYWAGFNATLGI